jgi:hypothetical protein
LAPATAGTPKEGVPRWQTWCGVQIPDRHRRDGRQRFAQASITELPVDLKVGRPVAVGVPQL